MNRFLKSLPAGATIAALTGVTVVALAGVALSNAFTLQVARNARVTSQTGTTKRENIAVSHGFAVYTLTGDTKRHPKCTRSNGCFIIWPPVTAPSHMKLTEAPGINGKLGVWARNGILQLTLAGHPLYRFAPDSQKNHATGEGIHSFGGTWHVSEAAGLPKAGTTPPRSTRTMTTTTSFTCLYPPFC